MLEDRLSAPCPKCHTEMIFVAALPHPQWPTMQKTTFVCYGCNQTRNYALGPEMAKAYATSHGDPLFHPFDRTAGYTHKVAAGGADGSHLNRSGVRLGLTANMIRGSPVCRIMPATDILRRNQKRLIRSPRRRGRAGPAAR